MHMQSLKLLPLMVKEEMHLQENTLFDLLTPKVKVTGNITQYHFVSPDLDPNCFQRLSADSSWNELM